MLPAVIVGKAQSAGGVGATMNSRQERPHPVEGEAFPQLGEIETGEARRMRGET